MIVITGANGQLGSTVVNHLVNITGQTADLAVSVREPANATDYTTRGIEVRQGDYGDKDSMVRAFTGADTIFIVSGDAPVDIRTRQQRNVVDAAKEAGVKRIVYSSFIDPRPDSPFSFAAVHGDTEDYIKASGLDYTILRNNHYTDNLLIWLDSALERGSLMLNSGSGKVAFISRDEIAEVTAHILTERGHKNKTYEITGAEAIDHKQVATLMTEVFRKQVKYRSVPGFVLMGILKMVGLPPFMIKAMVGLYKAVGQNAYANVSPEAEQILGRKPMTVATFLQNVREAQAKAA